MRRLLIVTAVFVAAVIFFLVATGPAAPGDAVWRGDPSIPRRTVAGAYHVHTTRSDGSADRETVAAAAARAGLQFIIFTDHGDGSGAPEPPAYLSGVLCLDGVEISTNGGHYVALGLPQAPYRLGGEPHAVVEDVARLGGFGFAAHVNSARRELAWTDWAVPFDGMEWLNADSEWRDESRARLTRVLFDYLLRPGPAMASMLDRPVTTLTQWDAMTARRRVIGIAGHDAHGGIGRGEEGGAWRGIPVPSYESSFRTFSTRVILERPFAGEPAGDAAALLESLRNGRAFTAIDALARGAGLDVRASGPSALSVDAAMPPGAELVVLQSGPSGLGAELKRTSDPSTMLELKGIPRGAFRVEVRLLGAPGEPPVPWVVSNPIYFLPEPAARVQPSWPSADAGVVPELDWHVEHDPASSGQVTRSGGSIAVAYRLAAGPAASQFVAAAADAPGRLPAFRRLWFEGESRAPMRISVQLRFGEGNGARWGRSVYLAPGVREVAVAADDLVPLDGQPEGRPELSTARSLLLVVDLTNAHPGTAGAFRFSRLTFER